MADGGRAKEADGGRAKPTAAAAAGLGCELADAGSFGSSGTAQVLHCSNGHSQSCATSVSRDASERSLLPPTHSPPRAAMQGSPALPDLSDRLKAFGMYGEYLQYRRGYLAWRQGRGTGARGELVGGNRSHTSSAADALDRWCPSLAVFRWRYTTAYWVGVLSLIGSLLFAVNAGFELTAGYKDRLRWTDRGYLYMTFLPNFLGSMCFVVAMYFSYLQLINMSTSTADRFVLVRTTSWSVICQQTRWDSVAGTLVYLLGAGVFLIAMLALGLLPEGVDSWVHTVLVGGNFLLGSLCFLAGALCEISHNHVFARDANFRAPSWWISVLNTFGGLHFTLGSVPLVTSPHDESWAKEMWVSANYLVGAIHYSISGVLLLVMWRANDFGLALISRLNRAVKDSSGPVRMTVHGTPGNVQVQVEEAGGEDATAEDGGDARSSFTNRGVFFIVIYCWFVVAAILVCICKALWYLHAAHQHPVLFYCDFAMQVSLVISILLLLIIHSAVARVPKQQPYKCVLVTVRFLFVIGAATQTALLAWWFLDPQYENELPDDFRTQIFQVM